jgi:hypothetical protein
MNTESVIKAIGVTAELTQTQLSGAALAVMAEDLMAQFGEKEILAALTRCRRELTGRLTLAAIIERLQSADSRPGANEAWGIAIAGFDEAETVVTNDEIMAAMSAARPVMDSGDEIGARMAFRDAYERIVRESREQGKGKPRWFPSLGHDPSRREAALRKALDQGLLPRSQVYGLLPDMTYDDDAGDLIGLINASVKRIESGTLGDVRETPRLTVIGGAA